MPTALRVLGTDPILSGPVAPLPRLISTGDLSPFVPRFHVPWNGSRA